MPLSYKDQSSFTTYSLNPLKSKRVNAFTRNFNMGFIKKELITFHFPSLYSVQSCYFYLSQFEE